MSCGFFTFWTIKWTQVINYEISNNTEVSSLKAFAVYVRIQYKTLCVYSLSGIQLFEIQCHVPSWHTANGTFRSTISFGCSKEDRARKMRQCHLLGGRLRNPLVLVPQQQLTVFLFVGKNIGVRTEILPFAQCSYHSTNEKLIQVTKCYNYGKREEKTSLLNLKMLYSSDNVFSLESFVGKYNQVNTIFTVRTSSSFVDGLRGASGKGPICRCRRHKGHGFDPWVGKICWSRKWQPATVFLPGKFHGERSLVGYSP